MDGLSKFQWFGATAARTIISIPVEREHAAAAEAGRIGASGTKAEARPTIARARSRRDIDAWLRKGLGRSDLAARSDLRVCEPFHIL